MLPLSVRSNLAGKWRQVEGEIDGEKIVYVASEVFEGHSLKAVPPDADLETARLILEVSLSPAGEDAALQELTRLRVTTRDPRDLAKEQTTLMMAAYAEDLAAYPEDVIKAACRNPPRWKFWPELGPLLDRAEAIMSERQQLADALNPVSVERARQREVAAAAGAQEEARHREELLAAQAVRQRRWDEGAKWQAANPLPNPMHVKTYASVADDPNTGEEPRVSTAEAMKLVQRQLAERRAARGGNFLPDENDPAVQARLRDVGGATPGAIDPITGEKAP